MTMGFGRRWPRGPEYLERVKRSRMRAGCGEHRVGDGPCEPMPFLAEEAEAAGWEYRHPQWYCPRCAARRAEERKAQKAEASAQRNKRLREQRQEKLKPRPCIVCGTMIYPDRRDHVICSAACKQKAWRRKKAQEAPLTERLWEGRPSASS
jgi:predicted nucleic acid-binding Zn ribbon protein